VGFSGTMVAEVMAGADPGGKTDVLCTPPPRPKIPGKRSINRNTVPHRMRITRATGRNKFFFFFMSGACIFCTFILFFSTRSSLRNSLVSADLKKDDEAQTATPHRFINAPASLNFYFLSQ
jgi:hypothetical protein